ncbi:MAG TPA: MauE/DoxX family redox-associated membrane protein [Candidatus Binataceae bacterium]
MTRRSSKYLEWMLRLVIGGVFIYAGWAKRNEGIEFADSVASFRILPGAVIVPFMLSIVPFEIGAGAMVLTGWQKRLGALGLLLMASLYSIALALALARGITVNCGCFGTSAVGANPWVDLGRDLLLAAGCAVLYRIATRSVAPKPAL